MTAQPFGLHELRLYHLQPQGREAYLALLVPQLTRYRAMMGPCVGHYVSTESDDLVVTLWRYQDAHDRLAHRAQLDADPQWLVFRQQVRPLVRKLESILLAPTPGAHAICSGVTDTRP